MMDPVENAKWGIPVAILIGALMLSFFQYAPLFLIGIVSGIACVLGVEALVLVYIWERIKSARNSEKLEAPDDAPNVEVEGGCLLGAGVDITKLEGILWVGTRAPGPEDVPSGSSKKSVPGSQKDERSGSSNSKRAAKGGSSSAEWAPPVRRHAYLRGTSLVLVGDAGEEDAIRLDGCSVKTVSGNSGPERKWARKFPLKIRHWARTLWAGSRECVLYAPSGFEKEAWCRALRAAAEIKSQSGDATWHGKLALDYAAYSDRVRQLYSFWQTHEGEGGTDTPPRGSRGEGLSATTTAGKGKRGAGEESKWRHLRKFKSRREQRGDEQVLSHGHAGGGGGETPQQADGGDSHGRPEGGGKISAYKAKAKGLFRRKTSDSNLAQTHDSADGKHHANGSIARLTAGSARAGEVDFRSNSWERQLWPERERERAPDEESTDLEATAEANPSPPQSPLRSGYPLPESTSGGSNGGLSEGGRSRTFPTELSVETVSSADAEGGGEGETSSQEGGDDSLLEEGGMGGGGGGGGDRVGVDPGVRWSNVLFARLFFDIHRSSIVNSIIQARIQMKLDRLATPSYMSAIKCTHFDVGNAPPLARAMRLVPTMPGGGIVLDVDLEYYGGARLSIETRLDMREASSLNDEKSAAAEAADGGGAAPSSSSSSSFSSENSRMLASAAAMGHRHADAGPGSPAAAGNHSNTPPQKGSVFMRRVRGVIAHVAEQVSQVPLTLSVTIESMKGTCRIRIGAPPTDCLWIGFVGMPDLKLASQPSIGKLNIERNSVSNWLLERIKGLVRDSLVLPQSSDVRLSFMASDPNELAAAEPVPAAWGPSQADSNSSSGIAFMPVKHGGGGGSSSSSNNERQQPSTAGGPDGSSRGGGAAAPAAGLSGGANGGGGGGGGADGVGAVGGRHLAYSQALPAMHKAALQAAPLSGPSTSTSSQKLPASLPASFRDAPTIVRGPGVIGASLEAPAALGGRAHEAPLVKEPLVAQQQQQQERQGGGAGAGKVTLEGPDLTSKTHQRSPSAPPDRWGDVHAASASPPHFELLSGPAPDSPPSPDFKGSLPQQAQAHAHAQPDAFTAPPQVVDSGAKEDVERRGWDRHIENRPSFSEGMGPGIPKSLSDHHFPPGAAFATAAVAANPPEPPQQPQRKKGSYSGPLAQPASRAADAASPAEAQLAQSSFSGPLLGLYKSVQQHGAAARQLDVDNARAEGAYGHTLSDSAAGGDGSGDPHSRSLKTWASPGGSGRSGGEGRTGHESPGGGGGGQGGLTQRSFTLRRARAPAADDEDAAAAEEEAERAQNVRAFGKRVQDELKEKLDKIRDTRRGAALESQARRLWGMVKDRDKGRKGTLEP